MKVIVSSGGTGGHIYPALAIIEEIRKQDPQADILFVGSDNGLEKTLVPKHGIPFQSIRVRGLPRKINTQSLIAAKELMIGLFQSWRIVKSFKPDVVIGTGCYASFPVLFVASFTKAFTLIHEQNSFPGITNKILSRFVDKVAVTYQESIRYFKNKNKIVVTGNPIRQMIGQVSKGSGYSVFDLDPNRKTIFSFGGSGGSESINKAMIEMLSELETNSQMQIIHVTGTQFYDDFLDSIGDTKNSDKIKIYPYMDHMQEGYSIADIIVTSSGAITLAEISSIGIPTILIPKAFTTENHQEFNARLYEREGAGVVILEKELTGKLLYDTIMKIINDDSRIASMKEASRRLGNPNAAVDIVSIILQNQMKIR